MFRSGATDIADRFLIVGIGGMVVALDRRDGERCWEVRVDAAGPLSIAVGSERVMVAAPGRRFLCLSYVDGAELWRAETSFDTGIATILIDAGAVFVARGGVVDCFGLDGAIRWYQPLEGLPAAHVVLALPGRIAEVPPG